MKVLVLGASGATGELAVKQLIKRQINTRIMVRKSAVLSEEVIDNPFVEIIKGNINELNDSEMNHLISGCKIVVSCLGHNVTLRGLFGKPRYLVFDAIRRVCEAAKNRDNKTKLILMSTVAYTNASIGEKKSPGEKIILALVNLFLPPHSDNVRAANFLINRIGNMNKMIEWVAVRPDSLVNDDEESPYEIHDSLVRSPIFNAGKASRINVSHFMAELAHDDKIWAEWKYKTPVLPGGAFSVAQTYRASAIAARSGYINSAGDVRTGTIIVGDDDSNRQYKGYLTFSLEGIARIVADDITGAQIVFNAVNKSGSPQTVGEFVDLKVFNYGPTLDSSDFAVGGNRLMMIGTGSFTSGSTAQGSLVNQLRTILSAGGTTLQVKMGLDATTNNNNAWDMFQFNPGNVELVVDYLE